MGQRAAKYRRLSQSDYEDDNDVRLQRSDQKQKGRRKAKQVAFESDSLNRATSEDTVVSAAAQSLTSRSSIRVFSSGANSVLDADVILENESLPRDNEDDNDNNGDSLLGIVDNRIVLNGALPTTLMESGWHDYFRNMFFVELFVAVVVSEAFKRIAKSFISGLVLPILSLIIRDDLETYFIVVRAAPTAPPDRVYHLSSEAEADGAVVMRIGRFCHALFVFLAVATVAYFGLKALTRTRRTFDRILFETDDFIQLHVCVGEFFFLSMMVIVSLYRSERRIQTCASRHSFCLMLMRATTMTKMIDKYIRGGVNIAGSRFMK
jgi:large-conductance mechanosensitive channel